MAPWPTAVGAVLYETAGEQQAEWGVPIATTVAALQALLAMGGRFILTPPCIFP